MAEKIFNLNLMFSPYNVDDNIYWYILMSDIPTFSVGIVD